jgi:hypothetical protein
LFQFGSTDLLNPVQLIQSHFWHFFTKHVTILLPIIKLIKEQRYFREAKL